ncbi:MAG: hypothetical protein JWN69_955 [Alphaproteobacteria bacterium]|nr:hypothetical protein [Alphaproteobacteria bacterium]
MLPSREELESNRLVQPVAHLLLQPALWRFTRRSVPRAIAVGLTIGIFVIIPFVQPVAAAMVAVPVRANVPLTVGTTLLTNPVTTPLLLMAALWIGSDLFGFPANPGAVLQMIEHHASIDQWTNWLLSSAAPALISGLAVMAVISGIVGYAVAAFVWRLWLTAKWRRRRHRHDIQN